MHYHAGFMADMSVDVSIFNYDMSVPFPDSAAGVREDLMAQLYALTLVQLYSPYTWRVFHVVSGHLDHPR